MASRNAQLMAPGWNTSVCARVTYTNKYIILTLTDTVDLSVGAGFFISTAGEHCNHLPLIFLFVGEIVCNDTGQLSIVSQTA
jgi:hypothetical protein